MPNATSASKAGSTSSHPPDDLTAYHLLVDRVRLHMLGAEQNRRRPGTDPLQRLRQPPRSRRGGHLHSGEMTHQSPVQGPVQARQRYQIHRRQYLRRPGVQNDTRFRRAVGPYAG